MQGGCGRPLVTGEGSAHLGRGIQRAHLLPTPHGRLCKLRALEQKALKKRQYWQMPLDARQASSLGEKLAEEAKQILRTLGSKASKMMQQMGLGHLHQCAHEACYCIPLYAAQRVLAMIL
eukprot:1138016-Pelagomonas_calceolata.AAC.3